jgi:hypothetical protein
MKTVLSAAFWVLLGGALVLSISSVNSINDNLKSIEERVDKINLMLDDMTKVE